MDADNQPLTIASNKKRVMTVTSIGIVGVLLGIVGFHVFMLTMGVNLPEQLMMTMDILGVEIDTAEMAKTGSMIGAVGILIALAWQNMTHSVSVVCYQDRLVESGKNEIPYGYVTRVHYNNGSILQNLLGYGTVFIEAGGMDKPSIQIEYVHDVENKVKELSQTIYQFKMVQQQQAQQDARIRNIVEQW